MTDQQALNIANGIAVLLPVALKTYKELQATGAPIEPLEAILARADVNWDTIIAVAEAEKAKAAVKPEPDI